MIPDDLLSALRESDPKLWGEYTSSPAYIYDRSDKYREAWLLYCLIQAIRARGWGYRLWDIGEVWIEAWVSMPNPERTISFKGDTEIDALLRAYLSALGNPNFKF